MSRQRTCKGATLERPHATYGEPRVHAELVALGIRVGRKRVARLMRIAAKAGKAAGEAAAREEAQPGVGEIVAATAEEKWVT